MRKRFLPLLLVLHILVFSQILVYARMHTSLIEVLSAETGVHVDGEWLPKTLFYHLDPIEVMINLKTLTSSPQNVCLTFTIIDDVDTPILFTHHLYLTQGEGEEVISLSLGVLPAWSKPGKATLSIAALTKLPIEGGAPFCPQTQLDLTVWWNSADVNNDYKVDFYDAVMVATSYSSIPSDPNWNPHCDIALTYGIINIYDVMMVLRSYGEEYSP